MVIRHCDRIEGTEIGYWISELGQDLTLVKRTCSQNQTVTLRENWMRKVILMCMVMLICWTLQPHYDISAAAEKEKEAARRPRHYLGNSKRTKE